MNLEEYTEKILPIIIEGNEQFNGKQRNFINYLYLQTFYGFDEFVENPKIYCSVEAERIFRDKLNASFSLCELTWGNQPKFDSGRKKLIKEHIFIGTMFRNAIKELTTIDVASVVEIIEKNYASAWILKKENKDLSKSKRGDNLCCALAHYREKGIELKKCIGSELVDIEEELGCDVCR